MIVPNKAISLDESALGRLGVILSKGPKPRDLPALHAEVASQFESIDQFLFALDILFVLGRIDVNFETRIISYAP